MSTVWRDSLTARYEQALELLEESLVECPDELWERSVWRVRTTDRHVWPIVGGVGADLPDEERLQIHSAFWAAAFHALLAMQQYLEAAPSPVAPPPPLAAPGLHELPPRVYSRDELLGYAAFCKHLAKEVVGTLSDGDAERHVSWKRQPFADLLLHNLLHFKEHVAQLHLFLNLNGDWSDSRWQADNRWFTACPSCDVTGRD